MWTKHKVNADPFPFRSGKVRLAAPGWLNGKYTEHEPRPQYDGWEWKEEA